MCQTNDACGKNLGGEKQHLSYLFSAIFIRMNSGGASCGEGFKFELLPIERFLWTRIKAEKMDLKKSPPISHKKIIILSQTLKGKLKSLEKNRVSFQPGGFFFLFSQRCCFWPSCNSLINCYHLIYITYYNRNNSIKNVWDLLVIIYIIIIIVSFYRKKRFYCLLHWSEMFLSRVSWPKGEKSLETNVLPVSHVE